jgi:SAM-dependent methyltransferase
LDQPKQFNTDHWYDGWFYDRWIAPNQDRLFGQIKDILPPGSTVLDVGCGTGRLAFALEEKCSSTLGVDPSRRNIERAQLRLARTPSERITFLHLRVRDILAEGIKHFDYAVLTYVLHEVGAEDRIALLDEVVRIADRVIIGDYLVPAPGGVSSIINTLAERAAGREHYRNYRSYVARGGLAGLIASSSLQVLQEFKDASRTSHLVVVRAARPQHRE